MDSLYGYNLDELLFVAELMKKYNVTPDELHELKNNFAFAFQIAWDEYNERAEREMNKIMERIRNE